MRGGPGEAWQVLTLLGLPKSEKDSELTELGPKGRDPRRPALSQSCLRKGSGLADWEEDLHAGYLSLVCSCSLQARPFWGHCPDCLTD